MPYRPVSALWKDAELCAGQCNAAGHNDQTEGAHKLHLGVGHEAVEYVGGAGLADADYAEKANAAGAIRVALYVARILVFGVKAPRQLKLDVRVLLSHELRCLLLLHSVWFHRNKGNRDDSESDVRRRSEVGGPGRARGQRAQKARRRR